MAKKDEPTNVNPDDQPPAGESQPTGRQAGSAAETVRDLADQTARAARQAGQQASRVGSEAAEAQRNLMAIPADAYRNLADSSRADVDAVLQSSARLAQGIQDMSWEMTQFGQRSVERGMHWASVMMDCRSVEDMLSYQRDFLRDSVDDWLAESARLLSLSSRMANDAVVPLSAHQQQAER